jgi:hypothetical protein
MGQSVVSETPGLLGGDTSDPQPQPPAGASTASRKCTRKTFMFYVILSLMLCAVAVGIYYIASSSASENESENPVSGDVSNIDANATTDTNTAPSQAPSEEEPALAPFDTTFLESDSPTPSPSYNFQDVMDLDQALLLISTAQDLEDPDTPQATCSYWLSHKDGQSLRVSEIGYERIYQRYVLCALYYATNGDEWVKIFLDETLHECDWNGVYCDLDIVTIVDLPGANLVGSLPEELIYLEQLQVLILYGNLLSGTVPSQLFELSSLVWFDLAYNLLNGPIPTPRTASPLEVLHLWENQFTGTLPFFPELQRMDVESNGFRQIDSRYATLESLTHLTASDNLLTGRLPDVWDAPNLSYLDLHSNQLTGPIPVSIWLLPKLESLGLDSNELTGALSFPFRSSNAFEHVWLHDNDLSGSIPASFGETWVNLTTMLLYDNQLSGAVDTQCGDWFQLERLETDCAVSCQCCTTECVNRQ